MGCFINHCTDPNAKFGEPRGLKVPIFAVEDIEEGEEILVDYGETFKWLGTNQIGLRKYPKHVSQ